MKQKVRKVCQLQLFQLCNVEKKSEKLT